MSKKTIVLLYLAIIAFTAFPIVCVLLAGAVAEANGCQLNEGSAPICIVLGIDIGGALYALFVMGWLAIVTIPTGALAFIALSIGLIVGRSRADGRKIDGLALVSVMLSATSVMIGPLGAIPGILCGYVAKKKISNDPTLRGEGLASTGIAIGVVGLMIFVGLVAFK